MDLVASTTAQAIAFPASAVTTCLLNELIEAIKADAAIRGMTIPTSRIAIATTPFEIDSLVVVANLTALDAIVGFPLPESIVQAGGYDSAQAAIDHLVPRIEALWNKRNKKGA